MRIIETKVYKYEELSDDAKAKARDWYREANADDNYFAEHITDDFAETLKAFGFDVIEGTARNGARRSTIVWSGFSSQGAGAGFSGSWCASEFKPEALLADRPPVWPESSGGHACPANAELHRIASELRKCANAGLTGADISVSRDFFMCLESTCYGDCDEDSPNEHSECFIEAARDLAHGFYSALEAEYDWQNADEQVADNIIANEYEFTEEGERV